MLFRSMKRIDAIYDLNWTCVGVFFEEKLVAISGYWINTRLYCGKYLYIDHFVVNEGLRSKGIGKQLLQYIRDIAKLEECDQVCLDTVIGNSSAQKFWFNDEFKIIGFHFVSTLQK